MHKLILPLMLHCMRGFGRIPLSSFRTTRRALSGLTVLLWVRYRVRCRPRPTSMPSRVGRVARTRIRTARTIVQVDLLRPRFTGSAGWGCLIWTFPVWSERLCEAGFLPDFGTLPVEDVDWSREDNGQESQECRWPFQIAHMFVHWSEGGFSC